MTPITVRIEDDLTARIDAIAKKMSERAGGADISRSNAARAAIDRGVLQLEEEFGMKRAAARPKARER